MKWLLWLALYWNAIGVAFLFGGFQKRHAAPVFTAAGAMFFLALFHGVDGKVLSACFALGAWQSAVWTRAQKERFDFSTWAAQTLMLTAAWLGTFYYCSWLGSTSHVMARAPMAAKVCGFGLVTLLPIVIARSERLLFIPDARPPDRYRAGFTRACILLAVTAMAWEAFRTDRLLRLFFHNWSVYVGVIQQLRHGAWLLWDLPSQYGFLNLLLISWIPSASAWNSLHLGNAFLLFVQALLLFHLLRRCMPTLAGVFVAAGLAFVFSFIVSGIISPLAGPASCPSASAMRFIWVYVTLIHILLRKPESSTSRSRQLGEGLLLAVSSLWSMESFFYGTLIWSSFYAGCWISARDHAERPGLLREMGIKSAFVLGAFGLVSLFYIFQLGHWPRWGMFFEHALSYSTRFGTWPMNYPGPAILFLYGLLIFGFHFTDWRERAGRQLGPLLAALAAFWGPVTYYVSRSHPNNATNLAPLFLLFAGALLLLSSDDAGRRRRLLLYLSPLLCGLLIALLGDRGNVRGYIQSFPKAHFGSVEPQLLQLSDPERRLLDRAAVGVDDRVLSLTDGYLIFADGDRVFRNPWLPVAPGIAVFSLSEKHVRLYTRRRIERISGCGWILDAAGGPDQDESFRGVVREELLTAGWRLTYEDSEGDRRLVKWCKG